MNTNHCGPLCACGSARVETAPPVNGGIDRRGFLAQGATAAMALALVACGLSASTPTSPGKLSQQLTVNLADYPDLANVDGVAYVSANGTPIALVRTSASAFVALSRICPHAGNTVGVASYGFYCPGHGAQFNFSGSWIGGQPTSNLMSYPTQYNAAAGTVTIG